LTSAYAGTSSARATMVFNVDASTSPAASFDVVWRWSGSSNVDSGGTCTATLDFAGVRRTLTAAASGPQELTFPMTVRHGDALPLTLDASCTSPGLVAANTLVNANLGIALNYPSVSGVQFNPVYCGP
jgi:hypothetical protein